MADIQFYHLLATPLERALPKLMEKALGGAHKVMILAESEQQMDGLNRILWDYEPSSFLPHGSNKDAYPDQQPIYLTCDASDNANGARILVIINGHQLDAIEGYDKILDMFDGQNEEAVQAARARWKHYKDTPNELSYIKQQPDGGWKKMEI